MHKLRVGLPAIFLIAAGILEAQPVIQSPAVNSASYRSPGMPGSGVAQGSIFFFYGTGLGPNSFVEVSGFPLPVTLGGSGGTSITVTVGGTQVSAIPLWCYYGQEMSAILPSNTPVGEGTFTVTYGGSTSAPSPISVVASAFGIYTYNEAGAGQAVATDVNYVSNTIIHTFHPGDYVTLWGTGLGAISASDADIPPTGNVGTVTVYIGNQAASVVTYHGRSGFAGLDQIDFQIPSGITGCYVPVAVETGGIVGNIGNFTTIAVSDSGQTCGDSIMGQTLLNDLAAGQTVSFGYIRLESWIATYVPGSAGNANEDFGLATFSQYSAANAGLAQYGVSSGYCLAVDCSYSCGGANLAYAASLADSSPAQLDAGTEITIERSPVSALTKASGNFYTAFLSNAGRYLWSGLNYPVSGPGGADVGAFSATDQTGIPTARLTGLQNSQDVPVNSDLQLTWSGGDTSLQDGQLTILINSSTAPATGNGLFEALQCNVPVSAQKFTIPAWILSALPPSGTYHFAGAESPIPAGWIQVGQYNKPVTFTAPGLTSGVLTDIFYNGVGVYFK